MNKASPRSNSAGDSGEYREIRSVTLVGSALDGILALAKVAGGYFGHSQALIADGIHSFSDLLTDLLVIVAARKASHQADREHPYGHGRIQTIATALLAASLALVACGVAWDAVNRLAGPDALLQPGWGALVIAAVSVGVKEGVFHYTMRSARRLNSSLLRANAWHSRTDALSSVVVIAGIIGAMLGLPWADSVAAIGVATMILYVAFRIGKESVEELIDTAVDATTQEEARQTIMAVPGVLDTHELRTRRVGSKVYADVHIRVAQFISVSEGHHIGDKVMKALKDRFERMIDVVVHIDPEDDSVPPVIDPLPQRPEIERGVVSVLDRHGLALQRHDDKDYSGLILHFVGNELNAQLVLPLPQTSQTDTIAEVASQIAIDIVASTPIHRAEVLFSSTAHR
ncbi:MAG: cation diffusion facilitator family transporter [Arenicellales bacterium]|nr:cation diffusion facilitator family transporter [Arenicellales bacterium]